MFDIDVCRMCGEQVGHQDDYCEDCIAAMQKYSQQIKAAMKEKK